MYIVVAGARPQGMSVKEYMAALIHMFPRQQFAQNTRMWLDGWNIITRHEVNTQASVQLRLTPGMVQKV